jgi:hypothetical protein
VIAHIGNVPVEEWLPFLIPVLALYLYGRHRSRRRREAVRRLPGAGSVDADTVRSVLSAWAKADHTELSSAHLPVLWPPGPDGATAAELAGRASIDALTVERLLEDLQELGYLDLEQRASGEPRAWLTAEGYDLVGVTEDALLASLVS